MTSTYLMVPAGPRPLYILIPVFALLLLVFMLLVVTMLGSQNTRFELSPAGLRLRGDLYGRFVPMEKLRVDLAQVVDLRTQPSLAPASRRMGTAAPGYAAGWFRLRNGERALLYLTDRQHALYVPTRDGYVLLLSPQRPADMLEELRRQARGS